MSLLSSLLPSSWSSESAEAKAERESGEPVSVRQNRMFVAKLKGAIAAHATLERATRAWLDAKRQDALVADGLLDLPRIVLPAVIPMPQPPTVAIAPARAAVATLPLAGQAINNTCSMCAHMERVTNSGPLKADPPVNALDKQGAEKIAAVGAPAAATGGNAMTAAAAVGNAVATTSGGNAVAASADTKVAAAAAGGGVNTTLREDGTFRAGDRVDAFYESGGQQDHGWWTAEILVVDGPGSWTVMYDDKELVSVVDRVRAPGPAARVGTSLFVTVAAKAAYRELRMAELALVKFTEPMCHLLRFLIENIKARGSIWMFGHNPYMTRLCSVLGVEYNAGGQAGAAVIVYRPLGLDAMPDAPIVNRDGQVIQGILQEVITYGIGATITWPQVRAIASPSEALGDKSIEDAKAIRAIAAATGADRGINILL